MIAMTTEMAIVTEIAGNALGSRVARVIAATVIIAAVASSSAATWTPQVPLDAVWVAAWGAAPDSPGLSIAGSTVRQIVRTSVAGSRVRLRFSNLFGSGPITLGPVRVALQASAGAIQLSSDRAVTFGGDRVVTVARGQDALSDPVNLALPALAHLAVTVHVPEGAGASTTHGVGHQTAYFLRGDATTVPVFPAGDADASRHFLTGVEVEAGSRRRNRCGPGRLDHRRRRLDAGSGCAVAGRARHASAGSSRHRLDCRRQRRDCR